MTPDGGQGAGRVSHRREETGQQVVGRYSPLIGNPESKDPYASESRVRAASGRHRDTLVNVASHASSMAAQRWVSPTVQKESAGSAAALKAQMAPVVVRVSPRGPAAAASPSRRRHTDAPGWPSSLRSPHPPLAPGARRRRRHSRYRRRHLWGHCRRRPDLEERDRRRWATACASAFTARLAESPGHARHPVRIRVEPSRHLHTGMPVHHGQQRINILGIQRVTSSRLNPGDDHLPGHQRVEGRAPPCAPARAPTTAVITPEEQVPPPPPVRVAPDLARWSRRSAAVSLRTT